MGTARKLTTADDFLQNMQGPRSELIDGVVNTMPPPKADHSRTQANLMQKLGSLWNKKPTGNNPGGWWIATEVGVRYGHSNVLCHDLAGWRRDRLPAWPKGIACMNVRPDWVCEILSTNFREDKFRKKGILHQWEVPYYWLVDPIGCEIRILEHETDDYKVLMDVGLEYSGPVPPFTEVPVSVKELFGIEDE